ncbi:MAG: mechanosensitive ion channel family protein [Candidatus Bostrichicola ureolyticus]|nr:MAG: mechanosensitive ion channel family protein [Candidatus Bostrichicola ureolyticus]
MYTTLNRFFNRFLDFCLKYKIIFNKKNLNIIIILFLITVLIIVNFFKSYSLLIVILQKISYILLILIFLQFLFRIINWIIPIITRNNNYETVAVRSLSQLFKIISVIYCLLIIISILTNNHPGNILTSLSALTAIIILIFRDIILGFVSGMQIYSTKMVKVGDYIAIHKYNIKGIILEINLSLIKLENFDKTITTVPVYDFISTAITNYELIRTRNIRLIKKYLIFNLKSLQVCNTLSKYKKSTLINDFIKKKELEIENNKTIFNISNKKIMTNISIYNEYIIFYLKQHPLISKSEKIIVRQNEYNGLGLPIEISCFVMEYNNYQKIMDDIFYYIIIIAKEFDLEVMQ